MADKQPSIVALIPARAGSKRVPDKNIRPLAGHPLIAYTISSALHSQVFSADRKSTRLNSSHANISYLVPASNLLELESVPQCWVVCLPFTLILKA